MNSTGGRNGYNRRNKYNRKRQKQRNNITVLIILCVVLVLFLAVIFFVHLSKNGGADGTAAESLQETFTVELPEGIEFSTVETVSEETPMETEGKKTEPETEAVTEPPETEPRYLDNLSGLAPGTIVDPELLDFDNLDRYFMSWEIEEGDNLYDRINGKSYRNNDYVPLSTLRYLKMPHYNFEGQIQVGEIIVNTGIKDDMFSIFKELFKAKYQIQSMYLVDNYWTGNPDTTDSASIDVNNTSAFCYREITGGGKLSNHAYGRAIDLNPQQNPYVSYSTGSPKWAHSNANDYIARDTGLSHVITHEDLAFKLFREKGFEWGGDWTNPKDYQHFDKNN